MWSVVALATEPVELRLWTIPDTSAADANARSSAALIDLYRSRHPEVELRKTAGIRIPQIGGSAPILMAIAGGIAPDVLTIPQDSLYDFVDQSFLLPVDDYLAMVPEEELRERAPPAVWDAARMPGPDGSLHTYAIPVRTFTSNLKVRHDLASKSGVPKENLPRTWEEMVETARALTDPDKGRYGMGLPKGNGLAGVFTKLLVSAGGQPWEQRDEGPLFATFDSPEGVAALDFLWQLTRGPWESNGMIHRGASYVDTSLYYPQKRGKFIMAFWTMSDRGMMRAADAHRFFLLPMPAAPNGRSRPFISALYMGIFAGQEDERVRRAAFDYIWMQGSREGRRAVTETLVEIDAAINASPVDLLQFGFEEELRSEFPDGYLEFYQRSLAEGYVSPTGKGANEINRAIKEAAKWVLRSDWDEVGAEERGAEFGRLLSQAAGNVNRRLHQELPASTLRTRKAVALGLAAVMFAAFAWQLLLVQRTYAKRLGLTDSERDTAPKRIALRLRIGLLLLPALALVSLWEYYPLARGTFIAFQDYRFLEGTRFVGADNFVQVIFSSFFWQAMGLTVLYVVLSLSLGFFTPILLAILLHELPRGTVLFRVLYYLPALTTGIVVIFLWKSFYEPGPSGLMNYLLSFLNVAPQRWLEDPRLAMVSCVLPTVWASVGPGCLIYLAALKSIPEELFEAGSIDGCGFGGKVRHIAVPYIRPLVIMNFLGVFIATFQSAGYILVLTGGEAMTNVVSLEIFYEAYARLNFGAAVAMSWILAFSLIGFTLFQIKYLAKLEFRSAGAEG